VSAVTQMTNLIYDQVIQSTAELDQLQDGLDTNQTRMQQLSSRTANLVNKAGGPRYCCIIMGLSLVAFILLLLVIYT